MNIIKLTSIVFALIFSNYSNAQSRTDIDFGNIGKRDISILKGATGWIINPEGKWVSGKNKIPRYITSKHNNLLDYEEYGLGMDNFISYKFKELTYKDSTYYVFIKAYRYGDYKYKNIREDWREYVNYLAYIINKEEVAKFDSLEMDQINKIEINVIDVVLITNSNEKEALELIPSKVRWEKKKDHLSTFYSEEKLIFHVAPYPGKGKVQFQIYSRYDRYYTNSGKFYGSNLSSSSIIDEHKIVSNDRYQPEKEIYDTEDLFKYCYYEVEYDKFMDLIIF